MKKLIKTFLTFIKNDLISKSINVLLIRMLGAFLLFGLSVFLTNYFPSDEVGKYDFSKSILVLLGGLSMLGMNQSIIYYSGHLKANKSLGSLFSIYKKMLFMVLISCSILWVIIYIIPSVYIDTFFEEQKAHIIILKTVSVIFFYALTMINIETFRGINKIMLSEIFRNIFRYALFFILVLSIHINGLNERLLDVFLLNFIFLSLISTPIVLYHVRKTITDFEVLKFSSKEILKRSYPMSIGVISLLLMQSIDVILLGKFLNFKNIAYYSVAVKLTVIITLVLTSVNAVFAPKIAELYSKKDMKTLKTEIKKATRLIFILTIPVLFILFVFSPYILSFFGEEYIEAKGTLRIMLFGQMFNTLCGSVAIYMNMTGKQVFLQKILLVTFVINLILNWVLIPKYGLEGAAISTTISLIFWNLVGVIYLLKKEGIKTYLH